MAHTLQIVGNSIQLNRNLSALDDGALGPFTIEATQNGVSGTANFTLTVSPVATGTITTRVLTEISGTNDVPVGSPFRCGVGFKQGDVPAGASFSVIDGGGNLLSVQADAVNHWPDGSVRWCEVRGYTAQAISPGGSDTLSFVHSASAFNNTLPNGKTSAQLLRDLQSFGGAQDLIIECDGMASCSGASNVYTTGNWLAHFNTLLAGPYVQQTNKGPCCMGFRAWGQLTNGSINHAHVHVCVYVWLWLNPSTGAIRDVEYIVYLHNSLLTQSTDGTLYSSFPPDRYNYNPVLKNGSRVIADNSDPTMLLHFGSRGVIGGHHPRSGWFTARADGKPRWIAGTVEVSRLHISLDPVQPNPQTISTARDYLALTGLLPHYDVTMTDCPAVPGPGTQSYAPMVKGVIDNTFGDWNTGGGSLDSGGSGNRVCFLEGDLIYNFHIQTPGTAQNNRITALGFQTFPARFLDINGRVPNCTGADIAGLTPHTRQSYLDCTTSIEQSGNMESNNLCGGWVQTANTTHYPNISYYVYLMEGGAHHRDCVINQSHDAVWWYQDCAYNEPLRGFGTHYGSNRAPDFMGKRWYGNACCNWSSEREEAWGFRERVLPPAVLPDSLADGTLFAETSLFKTYLANSCGFAAAVISNAMEPGQIALGAQFFYGGYLGSLTVPLPPGDASEEPWFQGYIGQSWSRAYILHHGEPAMSASLTTMANFQRTFHEQFANTRNSMLNPAQDLNIRVGTGTSAAWRTWDKTKPFPVLNWMGPRAGGNYTVAAFYDTTNGWVGIASDIFNPISTINGPFVAGSTSIILASTTYALDYVNGAGMGVTITLDDGSLFHAAMTAPLTAMPGGYRLTFTPAIPVGRSVPNGAQVWQDSGLWFPVPVADGMTVAFSQDFFGNSNNAAPPPFTQETTYYVVQTDVANRRFKLSASPGGPPIIPSVMQVKCPVAVVDLSPSTGEVASYTDYSALPPRIQAANGYQAPISQLTEQIRAIHGWQSAFNTANSTAAEALIKQRLLYIMGGSWSRTFFASLPGHYWKYP